MREHSPHMLAGWLLLGAACIVALQVGGVSAQGPSYVISVNHQSTSAQPYARGLNSKQMSISLGSGSNAVTYNFTLDTGSATLLATCRTPASLQNCNNNLPANQNYVLTPASTVSSPAVCSSTGFGCMLSNNMCFISEQLTGKPGYYNINNGHVAQDTITINNVVSQPGGSLSIPNFLFDCAEAYKQYTPQNPPNCVNASTTCPAAGQSPAPLFQGACPGNNHGIEAGWTFSFENTAPSAIGIPQQVFEANLISKQVTGICYQAPQKNTNCQAPLQANSFVTLGPALPRALRVPNPRLYSAPLSPLALSVFPATMQPGSASPTVKTFRSLVTSASVPSWGGAAPIQISFAGITPPVHVLWDTGAYGQSMVPTGVWQAFYEYYLNARTAAFNSPVAKRYKFQIGACANAAATCGANFNRSASYACQQITLPANSSPTVVRAAANLLLSMYPKTITINLLNGNPAQLPTAFQVNLCSGAASNPTQTQGVAVCSYVTNGGGFWVAGPWFTGRFVQFDGSPEAAAKYPNSTGMIYWSDPLRSCSY